MANSIGPRCHASILGLGMLSDANTMIGYKSIPAIAGVAPPALQANLTKRRLELTFYPTVKNTEQSKSFKLEIEVRQILAINEQQHGHIVEVFIQLKTPPTILTDGFTKDGKPCKIRCTNVATESAPSNIDLHLTHGSDFEMGRWLSYYLRLGNAQSRQEWQKISQVFKMVPRTSKRMRIVQGEYQGQ